MAHKKIIDSVKKQGQVAIKDLDEFLRFIINESDMRTYDDNYISILIPMKFDIDTFADGMCMDVRCVPRKDGPSWCEAAIYYADEDVVTSEPYNSFYNHWVCQTANATYHLYMCVADTE